MLTKTLICKSYTPTDILNDTLNIILSLDKTYTHRLWSCDPHLLVVVLPGCKVVHQGDPVAQLLAQGVQELVGVPAAGRPREGEQLLAAAQCVGAAVGGVRRAGGALQADVGVGVGTALVMDLVYRGGKGLLPGQGQA